MLLQLMCVLVLSFHSSIGFKVFQTLIPNGQNVPNTCTGGVTWAGVGHINAHGTGPRNVFGMDFAAENHTWTEYLCRRDSDGDGASNGVELGDPGCVWTAAGGVPPNTSATAHPGICEPVTLTLCVELNKRWAIHCTF